MFETDTGASHSYGWDGYRDYQRVEDGLRVRLQPFSGAFIVLENGDVDPWVEILRAAGVTEKPEV